MKMKPFAIIFSLAVMLVAVAPAFAAGGGNLQHSNVNIRDTAATQRGAKLFVNYCMSCHSASYMRYQRLVDDLGLSEEAVMENLVFGDAKIGQTMDASMRPQDAQKWLGVRITLMGNALLIHARGSTRRLRSKRDRWRSPMTGGGRF